LYDTKPNLEKYLQISLSVETLTTSFHQNRSDSFLLAASQPDRQTDVANQHGQILLIPICECANNSKRLKQRLCQTPTELDTGERKQSCYGSGG
jgi:hypothetical protein